MKKTLLIAAAALISASAFAQTVTSANIVGYTKQNLASGDFSIIAPQFLADATNGITIADAFPGVPVGSTIFAWDGNYKKYVYGGASYGWLDGTTFAPADTVLIEQGTALWIKSTATTNVIMSGEVPDASSIAITNVLAADFSLIANPYPVDLVLSNIPTANLTPGDAIFTWDGNYKKYVYGGASYGWLDGTTFAPAGSIAIPVGQGVWLKSATGGDLLFDKQF